MIGEKLEGDGLFGGGCAGSSSGLSCHFRAAGVDVQHMESVVHPPRDRRIGFVGWREIATQKIRGRAWDEVRNDVTSFDISSTALVTFLEGTRLQRYYFSYLSGYRERGFLVHRSTR